ncbi:MAG: glycine zipper domain-containing protein, partial [Gemmatimonadota bacterium]
MEANRAHARVAARRIDDVVHERPYESIAVALGVGVLLGAFMFR